MKRPLLLVSLIVCLFALTVATARAQGKLQPKTISARVAGLQRLNGYMPLYWDADAPRRPPVMPPIPPGDPIGQA